MLKRSTREEFIEKAKKIHGDLYDYSLVNYVGSLIEVEIICKEHGPFRQRPKNHLQGRGCHSCGKKSAIIKRSKELTSTTEEFIEKAKKIHGDTYDYSLANYILSSEDVEIICKEHGPFWQKANSHLSGKGCKKCGNKILGFLASTRNKYHYADILSSESDITSYLLGAFITDGCLHLSSTCSYQRILTLDSKDYDWLEKVRDIICPALPIIKREGDCYRLTFNQHKFVDWFGSHGISPRKSLNAKLPIVPEKYLPDLIRGCIDGDGSIGIYNQTHIIKDGTKHYYKTPTCYICSASPIFIQELATVLINVGFNPHIYKAQQKPSVINGRHVKGGCHMYKIKFSSKKANDFLQWAYYPNHTISMPRKYKLAQDIQNLYLGKNK